MKGDEVAIQWHNKMEPPDVAHSRQHWSDMYVAWSPLGSYLATFHKQGIALWGGASWGKIARFAHPNVKLIDFSPRENYLVTWSHEPFITPLGEKHVSISIFFSGVVYSILEKKGKDDCVKQMREKKKGDRGIMRRRVKDNIESSLICESGGITVKKKKMIFKLMTKPRSTQ